MKTVSTVLLCFVIIPVCFSQPQISSFSPVNGTAGTTVTIAGSGFGSSAGGNIVFFGAVKATVLTAASGLLTVQVPAGATYQPITVTTNGLTAYSRKPFTVTFPGAGTGFTSNSFAEVASPVTGNTPYDVITCDLDEDGKPDIITANNTAGTISIHRNTSVPGAVSYAPKSDIITGSGPYGIAAGDIDGDGKPEIVVTNYNDDNIGVLRNTSTAGNISFAAALNFTAGDGPQHVAIYDLDKDGKPDIAIANAFGGTISLLRNTGSIGNIVFAAKVDFALGIFPCRMAIGDLDGNGKADIAVACKLSGGVRVLQNISSVGTFSFSAGFTYATGQQPTGICMGDIDGDDVPDLAVSNSLSNPNNGLTTFSILRNISTLGNINFTKTDVTTASNVDNIAMDDLDGNGKPDIAVTIFTLYTSLYSNNSTPGNISLSAGVNCPGTGPFHIALCDMDGNGRTDIVDASLVSFKTSTLRNRLTEQPPAISSFSPASASTGMTVTINGSNFTGVTSVTFGGQAVASFIVVSPTKITAVVSTGASGNITIVTTAGTASLTGFTFIPAPFINSFTPAFAGPGQTVTINGSFFDNVTTVSFGGVAASSFTIINSAYIAAVVGAGATGSVSVSSADGTGTAPGFTYFPLPVVSGFSPVSGFTGTVLNISGSNFTGTTAVKIGGRNVASFTVLSPTSISAVAGDGATGNVSVTTPGGTDSQGLFTFPPVTVTSFAPASGPAGTAVTITGNYFSSTPAANVIYFGAARATVTAASNTDLTVQVPTGTTSQPVTVTANGTTAYFNQPFRLAFAGVDSSQLLSPVSYQAQSIINPGEHPYVVKCADLDGDGKTDEVMASSNVGAKVMALRNTSSNGNISFATSVDVTPSYSNISWIFQLADLNHDGKKDVIAGYYGFVAVYINTSTPGSISFAPAIDIPCPTTRPREMIAGDFDGDGKTDFAVRGYFSGGNGPDNVHILSIYRNTGINADVSFTRYDKTLNGTLEIEFINGPLFTSYMLEGDFDQDNKTDFIVRSALTNSLVVIRNLCTPGNMDFDNPMPVSVSGADVLSVADLDNDGKPDLAGRSRTNTKRLVVLRNLTSGPGNFAFALQDSVENPVDLVFVAAGEMTGDGRIDLAAKADAPPSISVYRNRSIPGLISFDTANIYTLSNGALNRSMQDVFAGDIDGDGKSDLSGVDGFQLSVFKNRINEFTGVQLCPPAANTSLPSGLTGPLYQWKLNTGSGFINITDDANYSGTNSSTLLLNNIPSSWYGYQYVCVANNTYSNIFLLQFTNTWTGAANNAWENPANWSCGLGPDSNTDVFINSGTVLVNSNTTIGSLTLQPGVHLTVAPNVTLTILH